MKMQNDFNSSHEFSQSALKRAFAGRRTATMKTNLEEKRKAAIEKRLSIIPKPYKKTYEKAVARKSMKAAIKAQCLECVGWEKSEVRNCTALACPLWAYRPYQEILKSSVKRRDLRAESPQTEIPMSR